MKLYSEDSLRRGHNWVSATISKLFWHANHFGNEITEVYEDDKFSWVKGVVSRDDDKKLQVHKVARDMKHKFDAKFTDFVQSYENSSA